MLCPNCETSNRDDEKFCRGCLQPLPAARAARGTGASAADAIDIEEYAGFWRRFAALLLDTIVLGLMFFAITMGVAALDSASGSKPNSTLPLLLGLGVFVLPLLYFVWMESGDRGATFGKRALKIRVVDLDGDRISFLRAFARRLAHILSYIPLYIGYVIQPFNERKQALHDMVAGTLVIKTDRNAGGAGVLLVIGLFFVLTVGTAGIGIPAYQSYVLKARVAKAMQVGQSARAAVEDFYAQQHRYPASMAETGAMLQHQAFLLPVAIDQETGEMTLTFNDAQRLRGRPHRISFTPTRFMDGSFEWHCTASGFPIRALPPDCD